jgi:hypothetical protein
MQTSINTFVNNVLFNIPESTPGPTGTDGQTGYEYDPQQLPQILNSGQWAVAPPGGLPITTESTLSAIIASPAINSLWASAQVVVTRISTIGLGRNPCDQDVIFDQGVKYCNGDTMYVLQAWPYDRSLESIDSTTPETVPGFDQLGDYGLSVETIAIAAENIQIAGGYFAPPPEVPEAIQTFQASDLSAPLLQDLVFFNIPVCDLDLVTLNSDQTGVCENGVVDVSKSLSFNKTTFFICTNM